MRRQAHADLPSRMKTSEHNCRWNDLSSIYPWSKRLRRSALKLQTRSLGLGRSSPYGRLFDFLKPLDAALDFLGLEEPPSPRKRRLAKGNQASGRQQKDFNFSFIEPPLKRQQMPPPALPVSGGNAPCFPIKNPRPDLSTGTRLTALVSAEDKAVFRCNRRDTSRLERMVRIRAVIGVITS